MTPHERTKLVRILGMLSSDHDGERAAAGLLATRIMRSTGVTWDALLGVDAQHSQAKCTSPADAQRAAATAICQRYRAALTDWEAGFLISVARRRSLTLKQRATLTKIADELPRRGNT